MPKMYTHIHNDSHLRSHWRRFVPKIALESKVFQFLIDKFSGLYGNDDLHNGLVQVFNAGKNLNRLFINVRNQVKQKFQTFLLHCWLFNLFRRIFWSKRWEKKLRRWLLTISGTLPFQTQLLSQLWWTLLNLWRGTPPRPSVELKLHSTLYSHRNQTNCSKSSLTNSNSMNSCDGPSR